MEEYLKRLRKQRYQIVGSHSAVKGCLWLSKSMRGLEFCYKGKFYGIQSHRCVQMTPSIECNQKCIFCWRPVEFDFRVDEWDSPDRIAEGVVDAHKRILWGYKGSPKTDMNRFQEALTPKHVAISLIGEPTLYPHLPKLIKIFEERDMTTFVVSNATNPEMIEKISPTMLYLSLDAPDRDTYMRVCRPRSDYWDNIIESLNVIGNRNGEIKRAVRITLVKNLNDFDIHSYG
jgi:tRNA wybutosine-synthesizing protein 1